MDALEELDDLIRNGLVQDLFKLDRALSLRQAIVDGAEVLQDPKNGHFDLLFGAFQSALISEAVLAAARVYEKPDRRYPNRCLERSLVLLEQHADVMPEIVEVGHTMRSLRFLGDPESAVFSGLKRSPPVFAKELAGAMRVRLGSAEASNALDLLTAFRSKRIAHNEAAIQQGPTWVALEELLSIAQGYVGVVGWAFFNTVYSLDGDYLLSWEAQMPAKAMRRLTRLIEVSGERSR